MNTMKNFRQTHRFTAVAVASLMLFSCSSDDDGLEPDDPTVINPPIVLDCDFFNTDQVLVDDPEAPVDYIITCETHVKAKLTVEPGVVIAFEPSAALFVEKDA